MTLDIGNIPKDDVGTFRKLRDMQVHVLDENQQLGLSMMAKLRDIQTRMHTAMVARASCTSRSPQTVGQSGEAPQQNIEPPAKISPPSHIVPPMNIAPPMETSWEAARPRDISPSGPPPKIRRLTEEGISSRSMASTPVAPALSKFPPPTAGTFSTPSASVFAPRSTSISDDVPVPQVHEALASEEVSAQANHQRETCSTSDISHEQKSNGGHGLQAKAAPACPASAYQETDAHSGDAWTSVKDKDAQVPALPHIRINPEHIDPNESCTLYVVNISFEVPEIDIVEYFNSVGGAYENHGTALSAVNLPYGQWNGHRVFQGRGFFLYGTPQIAQFARQMLNGRIFRGRPLNVTESHRRLECKPLAGAQIRGQSRWGEEIFNCPPPQ